MLFLQTSSGAKVPLDSLVVDPPTSGWQKVKEASSYLHGLANVAFPVLLFCLNFFLS